MLVSCISRNCCTPNPMFKVSIFCIATLTNAHSLDLSALHWTTDRHSSMALGEITSQAVTSGEWELIKIAFSCKTLRGEMRLRKDERLIWQVNYLLKVIMRRPLLRIDKVAPLGFVPATCRIQWPTCSPFSTFNEVMQRRPRLVLGWVTFREDRALWTCVRSSVWNLICDLPSI